MECHEYIEKYHSLQEFVEGAYFLLPTLALYTK